MNLIFAVIVAVLILTGYGMSRAVSKALGGASSRCRFSAVKIGNMGRAEVEKLLDRIEIVPEPEAVVGAMCYEPVALPPVVEYVCPVCGTKTDYNDYGESWRVLSVTEARMLFDTLTSLTRLQISLDETVFCSECRADSSAEPDLVLHVTWDDGSEHSSPVTTEDLRMLIGLFSGDVSYRTSNDGSAPLGPSAVRLREILGLIE